MDLDLRAEVVLSAQLTPVGPKERTLEGEPFESELVLHKDSVTEMGIWEVTPGTFEGRKDGVCEVMHIVKGAGSITDQSGRVTAIAPGVILFAPDGWRGIWRVTETLRKTYVISATPAGDRLEPALAGHEG